MTFTDEQFDEFEYELVNGHPINPDRRIEISDAITYLRTRDPIGAEIMREWAANIGLAAFSKYNRLAETGTNQGQRDTAMAVVSRLIACDIRALPTPTQAEVLAYARELPEVRALIDAAKKGVSVAILANLEKWVADLVAAIDALEPKP